MKLARGTMLVVASHNSGKVREIKALLGPHGVEPISAGDLGLAEPEETGLTFAANAELKARAAADASGHAAIADDSGLCVAALGGDPGIYSARWAGPLKDFRIAMTRVEQALREKEAKAAAKTEATYQAAAKTEATYQTDLSAKFVCALCVALPHGEARIFEGEVKGTLSFPPRGTRGFGYDPIFIADGMTETFGEIDPAVKHAMSHRARAFEKLLHGGLFPETM